MIKADINDYLNVEHTGKVRICLINEDEIGFHFSTHRELIDHLNQPEIEQLPTVKLPVDKLYEAIEPTITEDWLRQEGDILHHLERVRNADLSYPITMHNSLMVDGTHRIVKAYVLGMAEMDGKFIPELPERKHIFFKDPGYQTIQDYYFNAAEKVPTIEVAKTMEIEP